MNDLRAAATELLPLDADRREMALVYLAFMAQAAVVPALADAAEGAAQRLQEPLAARIAHAVQAGELPAHLDAEHEAARLRVLLDGLRLQLITTPRQTSARWALAVLDDHLAALAASPATAGYRTAPAPSGADDLRWAGRAPTTSSRHSEHQAVAGDRSFFDESRKGPVATARCQARTARSPALTEHGWPLPGLGLDDAHRAAPGGVAIGSRAIAVARTMGARCFRNK